MEQHRPLIGIPSASYTGNDKRPVFRCYSSYPQALADAGGAPVLIPLMQSEPQLFAIYEQLDGLLFTGGADINPRRYGQEPIAACQPPDDAKDHVELRLARWALEDDKPVLAICRGMQLLNVAANGTLYQDLASQYAGALRHNRGDIRQTTVHPVRLEPGTRLTGILGGSEIGANSSHHQAVNQPGRLFEVVGRAPDGVIEAIESPQHRFVLAVQWHPEELYQAAPLHNALFQAFIAAAEMK